jgi:Fe-S cluster assembly protein SufD
MQQQSFFSAPSDITINNFRKQSQFDQLPLLQQYRNNMQLLYKQAPIPHQKDDAWRFMPLPDFAWNELAMQNAIVSSTIFKKGVFLGDIRDFVLQYPAIAQQYFVNNGKEPWKKRLFSLLVESCWNRGMVLYVPKNVSLDEIITVPTLLPYVASLIIEKLIIVLEEGASIQLNDIYFPHTTLQTVFRSIDCYLAKNAQLTMIYDQQGNNNQSLVARTTFYLGEKSKLDFAFLMRGMKVNKLWLDLILQGQSAQAEVRGVYVLRDAQTIDITSAQLHQQTHTTSNLVLKGIVRDQAHAVYRGTIFIDKKARRTDASQENKNMLLSAAARAHSIPSLEVLNHDVQCSHGSAVGQFDREQLFYAQTRGLTEKVAKKLLLEGFLSDLFCNFDVKIIEKILINLKNELEI